MTRILWLTVLISAFSYLANAQNGFTEFNSNYADQLDEAVMRHKAIVMFTDDIKLADKEAVLQELNMTLAWEVPLMGVTYVRLQNVPATYTELRVVLEQLEQHAEVQYAAPILNSRSGTGHTTTNELFVYPKDKNSTQWADLKEVLLANGAMVEQTNFLAGAYKLSLTKDQPLNALELAVELNNADWVVFAEPNYILNPRVNTVDDPNYNRQWAHRNDANTIFLGQITGVEDADMDVDSAWTITMGNANIKIAIVDSGTDTTHADLENNLLPGYDATGTNSNGYPNTDKNSNAHGTACAGIVAAEADNGIGIAGVAPECKIVPVKVFYYIDTTLGGATLNDIPYSTAESFADGLNWAWQTAEAHIMSNSWGVDDITLQLLPGNPAIVDSVIDLAVTQGRNGRGTVMFFSSGNEDFRPIWPSRLPQTIAVNATSMCDERKYPGSCDGENWWTGCWGEDLDFSAPGVKVMTCDISSFIGYTTGDYTSTFNGTSAACPHAAGVGALVLSIRPDVTAEELRWIMGTTAEKIGDYDYAVSKFAGRWSDETGYGRINAYQALLTAQNFSTVTDYTGIARVAAGNVNFKVYPNPTAGSNTLNVSLASVVDGPVNVALFTISGQQIFSKFTDRSLTTTQSVQLPLDVESGVYIVRVSANDEVGYQKLIVSK